MLKQLTWWQIVLLFLFILLILSFGLVSFWISQLDISKLENPLPEPTLIYDRNSQPASQLSSSRIIPVPLQEIPIDLRNAVIAVEDQRFYEHSGVDYKSIARALLKNMKSGGIVEGGSTITQQLVKNLFLGSERSYWRKIKEAGMAIKIESTYSKDEILEMYLNQIYFGEGCWGVEQAARYYFGKNVQDLTLAESALIAALPKAPTHYSPFKNKEKALERRNLVLSLMKEQGYISESQYQSAKAAPLELNTEKGDDLKGRYPSYVDYVIEEAISKYGFTEEQLLTGGLRIYTQLDPTVQKAMEEVYENDQFFPESAEDQLIQSGAVVIDPYTGGIRGLIGSRGDHHFRGFNHAYQLRRQPGSTIKPLVVYAPALEKGYTPASMLYDGELNINGYTPKNWDHRYRGQVSLYEALIHSWNIPAVWLLNEIGIETGVETAKKLGIPLEKEDRNLGIALGGLYKGVSPLQMAQAYSVFPNLGKMKEAYAITKITTRDGYPLIEADAKEVEVFSPTTAYQMSLLLQEVVKEGTGKRAALDRPTAGKTGSTQLPDTEEFAGITGKGEKDVWFVGYTPELVAAVWMGYDQTDRNHYLTTSGGAYPAIVFREILSRALKGTPVTQFQQPENWYESGIWGNRWGQTEDQIQSEIKKEKHEKKWKGKKKKD